MREKGKIKNRGKPFGIGRERKQNDDRDDRLNFNFIFKFCGINAKFILFS